MPFTPLDLKELFGQIDIYLFDQLLKGRFPPGARILDGGCGEGRNLVYFLRSGYDVCAIDQSEGALDITRRMATQIAPTLPESNFRVERLERMTFPDASFDAVLLSAVLHFAKSEAHFDAMVRESWRVLRPGGMLFARLASTIGIESRLEPLGGRRYHLPDGSDRFLVDEEMLMRLTSELGASLLEPVKTVNVQNERCMTTWCVAKRTA